jgi:hypothetical protein
MRFHNHVKRRRHSAQTAVGPPRAPSRSNITGRNDHKQIDIAILRRRAPGVGAEEDDPIRIEFVGQPGDYLVE